MKHFLLAPQNTISDYDIIAQHFFHTILHINYSHCLVTDESYISDFINVIMNDEDYSFIKEQYYSISKNGMLYTDTRELFYSLQDSYLYQKLYHCIQLEYAIPLWSHTKDNVLLTILFDRIIHTTSKSLSDIEQEVYNLTPYIEKEYIVDPTILMNNKLREKQYTEAEIQKLLITSTKPFFLMKHMHISLKAAKKIVNSRLNEQKTIYEP